jgi:hypothetical protein
LLYECLFFVEGKSSAEDVKCRHSATISSALKALVSGSKNNIKSIVTIMANIKEFHLLDYWRTPDDWSISVE